MSVLYIMIPAALLLAALGIIGFIYAVKNGQFDDLDTPALRAVFDDDDTVPPAEKQSNPKQSTSDQDPKDNA